MNSILKMSAVERTISALEKDLVSEGGPRIATLHNYPFAILCYDPKAEFELRREVAGLAERLKQEGWFLETLNMKSLVLRRLREFFTPDELDYYIESEKMYSKIDGPQGGLEYINDEIFEALHGPDGIAGMIARRLDDIAADVDRADRTIVLIGQLGALYPFGRTSAVLKFLDGRTHGIPVVFLYPGTVSEGALSFLGEAEPDRDYRPRIYTADSIIT